MLEGLPNRLFGYRRADVKRLVQELEAADAEALEANGEASSRQEVAAARAEARRRALEEILAHLEADTGRLRDQVARTRESSASLEEGARREAERMRAAHEARLDEIRRTTAEVNQEIRRAEAELASILAAVSPAVEGAAPASPPLSPDASTGSPQALSDMAVAIFGPDIDVASLSVSALTPDLFHTDVPSGSARVQTRSGEAIGTLKGIVLHGRNLAVIGYEVSRDGASRGAIPASEVVAVRRHSIIVADGFRLLDATNLPREESFTLVAIGSPPSRPRPDAPDADEEDVDLGQGSAEDDLVSSAKGWEVDTDPDLLLAEETPFAGRDPSLAPTFGEEPVLPADTGEWELPDREESLTGDRLAGQEPASGTPAGDEDIEAPMWTLDEAPAEEDSLGHRDVAPAPAVSEPDAAADLLPPADWTDEADGAGVADLESAPLPVAQDGGRPADLDGALPSVDWGAEVDDAAAEAPEPAWQPAASAPQVPVPAASEEVLPAVDRGTDVEDAPAEPARSAISAAPAEAQPPVDGTGEVSGWGDDGLLPPPDWGDQGDAGTAPAAWSEPAAAGPAPAAPPPTPPVPQAPAARPRPAASAGLGDDVLMFLEGKIVGTDIYDAAGNLIAAAGTPIDAALVARAEAAGRLPDLIVYMTLPQ